MRALAEVLLILAIGCFTIAFFTYSGKDKFTATISVTDRAGNPVNVKPKSVVCLAERPNETLICRVESVR